MGNIKKIKVNGTTHDVRSDAYVKPSGGIPASDIATGVIPDVSAFITKSVNDLVNYYTKSQTYTQTEVNSLIGAINQFRYEIAASTSSVTDPQSNVLYLIGPTGSGSDKYEEYVYPNSTTGWTKIGDTTIDLSGYVTTTALNTALSGKQDTISDLSTIRSGASAGATAYQKPSDGIPKTDVSSTIQTSLDNADNALPVGGLSESKPLQEFVFRKNPATIKAKAFKLTRIYGNTFVYNNAVKNGDFSNGGTDWQQEDITATFSNNMAHVVQNSTAQLKGVCQNTLVFTVGHKYLVYCEVRHNSANKENFHLGLPYGSGINGDALKSRVESGDTFKEEYGIIIARAETNNFLCIKFDSRSAIEYDVRNVRIVDVTLMYGAGSEPTTGKEITNAKDFILSLPNTYTNPGALISNDAAAVKTVGFNQFDEEWVLAYGAQNIKNKNYIPVLPNTEYCFTGRVGSYPDIYFFDRNNMKIGGTLYLTNVVSLGYATFTTPENAAFIGFQMSASYGTTYNHDICINLSDPAKNGTYEPYWKRTIQLGLSTFTGKLNGQGASVVVFPDGMNGVGTDRDAIRADGKTADKTRARVNLGSLNWSYYAGYFYTNYFDNILPPESVNFICVKYVAVSPYGTGWTDGDKVMRFTSGNGAFNIKDSDYTDPAAFKASLNGVYLDYQLATPETYVLDEPLVLTTKAGTTEERISPNADGLSAPMVADMTYEVGTEAYADVTEVARFAVNAPTKISQLINDSGFTTNIGTITEITMNGASKGTSGVVDLGTVITSHQDVSGKEDKSNKVTSISSSSTDAQYPTAKCLYTMVGNIETILATI